MMNQPIGNIKSQTIDEILNGPTHTEIKQSMAQGQWHPHCQKCQNFELIDSTSARTRRRCSQESLDKINNDFNWFEPQHVSINWSNLCNLSCTYCNPQTSTAWQAAKKLPITHVKNEHDSLIQLAKKQGNKLQGLSLGGGEPLLQPGLMDFLNELDPTLVNVLVTTNLSVNLINNKIYQKLKTWPLVEWQISFDNCNKQKFEYVRHGADWDQFVNNIKILQQDQQRVMAHPAYSIYCAFDLAEYYEFCKQHDLEIFWCNVTHPWALDVCRLPKFLRDLAITEIDYVVENYANAPGSFNILLQYRTKLLDPSSFQPPVPGPIEWHSQIEKELNKTTTFEQLWPNIVEQLRS
jgi:organic radical activating enzyme